MDTDQLIDDNINAHLETKDSFVLPIKQQFEELRAKINNKTWEINHLTEEFYKRVSSTSIELEGIGPEQEAEIERHRHLYEMQQLMGLEKRLRKAEEEKIKLLKQE